jgi:anaerobic dimethyl sulfoxide reductase subunit B (iron-sulfur subunit)
MAKQLGFFIDQNSCTGCKACQIACNDKNNLDGHVKWRRVAEYTGGTWSSTGSSMSSSVYTYYTSISCNHCADPICVKVCPTQAMNKGDDGIVSIDPKLCVGCRYCEWACPYGAPQFDSDAGVMTKCNFCADYLAEGKDPACVAACPSRVLQYGELADLESEHGTIRDVDPLPDPSITHPSLVIAPHRHAQRHGAGNGVLANPQEV